MSGHFLSWLRRRRLRWYILLAAAAAAALCVFFDYLEGARRAQLIADVRLAGGMMDDELTNFDALSYWFDGGDDLRYAILIGPRFDSAWIRDRNYLRDLPLQVLMLRETSFSETELAALVQIHPLESFSARDSSFSEDVIDALSQKHTLRTLRISGTKLDDAALARLRLEQILWLDIARTQVTTAGLQHLQRCESLQRLGLDGNQLGDVALLGSFKNLQAIWLTGPEVTDDHLRQISSVLRPRYIGLTQTSTTSNGHHELQAALPGCWLEVQ